MPLAFSRILNPDISLIRVMIAQVIGGLDQTTAVNVEALLDLA